MNPATDDDARAAFEGFHWGRPSRRVRRVSVSRPPRRLVQIGRLEAITYSTRKGRGRPVEHFEHEFGETGKRKPVLAFDADNRRLHIVGGAYGVQDRGIVD